MKLGILVVLLVTRALFATAELRVGAVAADFVADDTMPIGGSILPGKAQGRVSGLISTRKPPMT